MALTGNSDINSFAINKFGKEFGENGAFRLVSRNEGNDSKNNPKEGLFSKTADFSKLSEVVSEYPSIQEIAISSAMHYNSLIDIIKVDQSIIPLFLKTPDGDLRIISSFNNMLENITEGFKLVYLGKVFDTEITENT